MTRKQHIENLKAIKVLNFHNKQKPSIQYAIDHLSREWVSRKTHREKMNAWLKKYNDLEQKLSDATVDVDNLAFYKSEIDHLKADKDRMQFEYNSKQDEVNFWVKDWEKESDKVSNLQNKVKWLYITTAILFIVLVISLLNCG